MCRARNRDRCHSGEGDVEKHKRLAWCRAWGGPAVLLEVQPRTGSSTLGLAARGAPSAPEAVTARGQFICSFEIDEFQTLARASALSKEFAPKDVFTNTHLKNKCFSSHSKILSVDKAKAGTQAILQCLYTLCSPGRAAQRSHIYPCKADVPGEGRVWHEEPQV